MACFPLKTPLIILFLAALLIPAAGAAALQEDAGVRIAVTPSLGGNVKYGEWMALQVSLENAGADVNDAEVQSNVMGNAGRALYALPVPLPAGARKVVTLYVIPPTFGQAINVQVVTAGRQLAKASVPITARRQVEFLIGAVAPDPDALALLNGLTLDRRGSARLVPLTLADLPERFEVLRSLDALILCGVDTTALTPAQGRALQTWVEAGGRLFLGGGAGAERVLAGLPAALQVVRPDQAGELTSLDALADWGGQPIQVPGPFLAAFPAASAAASAAADSGRPAIVQDGRSLLVQSSLGRGWVHYLALDPTGSPFDAWSGALPFWSRVFLPGSALPQGAPLDVPLHTLESQQMTMALYELPVMDLPSLGNLVLLIGIYIVLVGPVNYFVLRRWGRLSLAWATIPALTIVFAIAGFVLGYQMHGGDVAVQQLSIVETYGSGRPIVRSYIGLFSPARASYDARVDGDALLSLADSQYVGGPSVPSSQGMNLVQGNPALVRDLGINQWAMSTFQAEAVLDSAEGLQATVYGEGQVLEGELHNSLDQPLYDLVIISGQHFARLGDLAAGEKKPFKASLSSGGSLDSWSFSMALLEPSDLSSGGESRERMLRYQVLNSYLRPNEGSAITGLVLLGWSDWAPVDVQVDGVRATRSQLTLVVSHLPLLVGKDGQVDLPLGHIVPTLSASDGAEVCGPGSIYLYNGRATLDYTLPQELYGLRIEGLTVQVDALYVEGLSKKAPDLSLYDWTAQAWVRLPDVNLSVPLEVEGPARFLDPVTNTIRLQAESTGGWTSDCLEYSLGIRGMLAEEGGL